jgi:tRNA(Ile)-lysidine synthase
MLIAAVRRTIRRFDLLGAGPRVVVGLSGGADSVALVYLLRELDAAGELKLAGLAHFNHQLRVHPAGASDLSGADRDERFCVSLAEAMGLPILAEREDVRLRAVRERRSLEDAAHVARYAFFERARVHFDADAVAVGHTRDDQAETFLLRLLRGAGPRGLAAMHPRRGAVIRPLLECRRADLRAYLDQRHIPHVEDETNSDVSVPRNRVRAELLPLLEARFNPAAIEVLADQAELARGEWSWMEGQIAANGLEATSEADEPGALILSVSKLERAPIALARLAVWTAMTAAAGGRAVSFRHVEDALQLIQSTGAGGPRNRRADRVSDKSDRSTQSIDAPGHSVERAGTRLVLRVGAAAGRGAGAFRYLLPVPGEVELPEARCVVSAEPVAGGLGMEALRATAGNRASAVVRMPGRLAVRNRRPGDRFRPLGLGGEKKLQDFFVDRKVARRLRDGVPLVVDDSDRIVWVAGHGIDEAFRVTDASQAVVILKLRPV